MKDRTEWRKDLSFWQALCEVFEVAGLDLPAPGSVFQMAHLYPLMDWIMERKGAK